MTHALTYDDETDFWLEVQRAKNLFTRGLSFGVRLPGSLDDGPVPPCELTDAEVDWLWPRYQACSFPPATFAKRFARNDRASLTPKGKNAAVKLAYTYRRQIFGKVAVKWDHARFLEAVRAMAQPA